VVIVDPGVGTERRPLLVSGQNQYFVAPDNGVLSLVYEREENVVVRHADGLKGWREQAPFDRMVLSAAVESVPPELITQLKPGGILIAPVGAAPPAERVSQRLVKIIRTESGHVDEPLMSVVFVPMVPGLPQESRTLDGAAKKQQ
jgi:protein-L-isoaspartate(D-aspartate) O-methyltransferase